jgi:hypothetical protein
MIAPRQGGGGYSFRALALALGVWALSGSPGVALGGDHTDDGKGEAKMGRPKRPLSPGTLGYGGPGLYPGFSGFGLSFHPGYGYGGYSLGVGAEGGYPNYAGPGYPHEPPPLRRLGRIEPYCYYGGPVPPCYGVYNVYEGIGGLVVDPPVVISGIEQRDPSYSRDYGLFSGAIPYPESVFSPATAEAAAGRPYSRPNPAGPPTPPAGPAPGAGADRSSSSTPGRSFGIDEAPVVEADGVRGLTVVRVEQGTAAEKAGLHPGDVIHSANGYFTRDRGNLAWIIANASPDNVLNLNVRTIADGKEHTISARVR